MKYLTVIISILLVGCNSTGENSNEALQQSQETYQELKKNFIFINHRKSSASLQNIVDKHIYQTPFYLKLFTSNASSNIYFGKVTETSVLDKVWTYLPSTETTLYYEIFNSNGFSTSGQIDI